MTISHLTLWCAQWILKSFWLFWGLRDSIRNFQCGLRLLDPVWENDSVLCRGKHLQLLDKQVILSEFMALYTGDQTNQRRAGHLLCFVNLGFWKIWKDSLLTHVEYSHTWSGVNSVCLQMVREGMTQHTALMTNSLNTGDRDDSVRLWRELCLHLYCSTTWIMNYKKMMNYSYLLVLWKLMHWL